MDTPAERPGLNHGGTTRQTAALALTLPPVRGAALEEVSDDQERAV